MTLVQAAIRTQQNTESDEMKQAALKDLYLHFNRRMVIYLIERNISKITFRTNGRAFQFEVMPSYDNGKINRSTIYDPRDTYYRTSVKIMEVGLPRDERGNYPSDSKYGRRYGVKRELYNCMFSSFHHFAIGLMRLFLEEKSDQYALCRTEYGKHLMVYTFKGIAWTPEDADRCKYLKCIRDSDRSEVNAVQVARSMHTAWVQEQCRSALSSLTEDERLAVIQSLE